MNELHKKNKSSRRRTREFVVQALYQAALNQLSAVQVSENISEHTDFKRADAELFRQLFFGAYNHQSEYMALVRPYLVERDETAINPVERSVLLMAIHELQAMPETPHAVVINEAIEVTKTFGGTDSHKFINGILDKLVVQLRPNDPKHAA